MSYIFVVVQLHLVPFELISYLRHKLDPVLQQLCAAVLSALTHRRCSLHAQ